MRNKQDIFSTHGGMDSVGLIQILPFPHPPPPKFPSCVKTGCFLPAPPPASTLVPRFQTIADFIFILKKTPTKKQTIVCFEYYGKYDPKKASDFFYLKNTSILAWFVRRSAIK